MTNIDSFLETYNTYTNELASLYGELAEIKAALFQQENQAWDHAQHQGWNTTESRQYVKQATERLAVDALRIQGSIDSLLAHLRYLDRAITAYVP